MWSTLREEQSLADCYEEFLNLYKQGDVDLFFWHWVETDSPYSDLAAYMTQYERDLRQIMDDYVNWLARGEVMPIIHINELILYLLTGKQRGTSACAVEMARNFDIMGGKVHPCADLPPEYAIGSISDDGEPSVEVADLSMLIEYKDDLGCYRCGIHAYCGGRCPVQAITGSKLRMEQYCRLMRLHVGIVQEYLPDIINHVERNDLDLQDIYDQSAHYAQFTDVTP
jgi:radical SAM protein with 4Fe4S-binding SPASM domain